MNGLSHQQKEHITKMIEELTKVRGVVAGMRSSIYLKSGSVDPVTMSIAGLQQELWEVLKTGQIPPIPKFFTLQEGQS